jgi:hypothetical protein
VDARRPGGRGPHANGVGNGRYEVGIAAGGLVTALGVTGSSPLGNRRSAGVTGNSKRLTCNLNDRAGDPRLLGEFRIPS